MTWHFNKDLFGMSGLKEGAVRATEEKSLSLREGEQD
jgi:hypothetical protein